MTLLLYLLFIHWLLKKIVYCIQVVQLYEKLKKEQSDFLQKLTVIESNLDTMNLGLSQRDRNRLLDTNVIFHGATIVRFNQRLRMANVNVQSTKQILLLAKEMPDLKVTIS